MAQIKISNVIPDEESLLTQKTVQIGQNIPSIKTPFKILDFNYAPQGSNLKNTELIHINDNSLLEKSRSLNQTTFENAINDVDLVYLRESYENFRNVPFLKDKIIINTITFNFNPYTLKNATDKLDTFLDIYYGKSDFLFIPNIKAFTYENKNRKSIISKEEYVKYLSEAYNNLKFRNNKPIFIPISLKMGPNSFKSILTTLLDEGHRFFWLDFEGAGSLKYSPQIRGFHKIIDKMGLIDNVLLYATNIRREINPHATDEFCGASDILSSPLGVDIIGVNKSPQAGGGRPLPIHLQIEHKARFFDKTSYNYVKYLNFSKKKDIYQEYHLNDELIKVYPKFFSNYTNSFELNNEFRAQMDIVNSDESFFTYLKQKSAIKPDFFKKFKKILNKDKKIENFTIDDFI